MYFFYAYYSIFYYKIKLGWNKTYSIIEVFYFKRKKTKFSIGIALKFSKNKKKDYLLRLMNTFYDREEK